MDQIALPGDERGHDGPAGDPLDVADHTGQLHPGVLQLLLQALDLLTAGHRQFGAPAGQITQLADRPRWHERADDHSGGAGSGQERRIRRIGLTAPDTAQVCWVDQHQVQRLLQRVVHIAPRG